MAAQEKDLQGKCNGIEGLVEFFKEAPHFGKMFNEEYS